MKPLTPQEQAERDRLQAIIDETNRQIVSTAEQIKRDLEVIARRAKGGNDVK